ncbi:MAG TPA: methyltransferase [Acidimicrobiales bacterium]|nr:methyltransferase [Acidimicrobiales bacterium]
MGSSPPPEHYFSTAPAAPSRPSEVRLDLPDRSFVLRTDRGVFSAGRVDPGTKVLLLTAPDPPPAGDLVDLGTGYGPIALTMAARSPGATVWAVDPNERALALTRANADAAGLANVRAVRPDEFPPDLPLAGLWSNPPVRVGKAALHDLLRTWLPRLAGGAHAVLVVQKHLGADSLQRWLRHEGWAAERRASRMAYRVLDVSRPGDEVPS